ncbi:recombinase family protein [Kribbella sp. NPDC005582]|uniref:recombinase family protein n=1 Tax=Kribbella sp. NPDC005582 TaxID=3156893 RepID=UPI0033A6DCE3
MTRPSGLARQPRALAALLLWQRLHELRRAVGTGVAAVEIAHLAAVAALRGLVRTRLRARWRSAGTSAATTLPGPSHGWIGSRKRTFTRHSEQSGQPGDQLVITKLDRLGRSLEHLIDLSKDLQTREVDLVVLDQGIDTSTAVGRMFFQILGSIAEFEHALMSERTLDGLAAARARGRTGGQKPKLGTRQVTLARQMYEELADDGKRRYTVAQIAAEFGVTRPTIYRHLSKP